MPWNEWYRNGPLLDSNAGATTYLQVQSRQDDLTLPPEEVHELMGDLPEVPTQKVNTGYRVPHNKRSVPLASNASSRFIPSLKPSRSEPTWRSKIGTRIGKYLSKTRSLPSVLSHAKDWLFSRKSNSNLSGRSSSSEEMDLPNASPTTAESPARFLSDASLHAPYQRTGTPYSDVENVFCTPSRATSPIMRKGPTPSRPQVIQPNSAHMSKSTVLEHAIPWDAATTERSSSSSPRRKGRILKPWHEDGSEWTEQEFAYLKYFPESQVQPWHKSGSHQDRFWF